MSDQWYLPAGSTAADPYALCITPDVAGWGYTSLRVLHLPSGGSHTWHTGDEEIMVVPLAGGCTVHCDGEAYDLEGRRDVFSRITDCAYVPREATVRVTSASGGRFALAGAHCTRRLPFRYRAAEEIPVEVRGAGSCTRQVNNFCAADSFDADRLIAVEVLTPGGNWSSYPPHKHDEDRPGIESALEEIYYFEVAAGPAGPGFAYQRVYGTPERPIDVLVEVRTGDAVLVPHGWHGPSIAAPGYDLYYLNVMAGASAQRAWHTCDDPVHGWVRASWAEAPTDPRVPLTSIVDRSRS